MSASIVGASMPTSISFSVLVTLEDGQEFNFPQPNESVAIMFAELVRLRGFVHPENSLKHYAPGAVKSTEIIV